MEIFHDGRTFFYGNRYFDDGMRNFHESRKILLRFQADSGWRKTIKNGTDTGPGNQG
jgi:hypothetical protein